MRPPVESKLPVGESSQKTSSFLVEKRSWKGGERQPQRKGKGRAFLALSSSYISFCPPRTNSRWHLDPFCAGSGPIDRKLGGFLYVFFFSPLFLLHNSC